ncbi:hypothetical protein EVAR_43239_1 [Eumeta japonica]|uniref:Uncharacterized protein n=1 Tax=Eumeta variegata TaxID=151549 RepID=A0A4C1WVX2_EUMVA|nr:hypothetical protein EVAR_43239_1 [Eumeta japonica]
MEGEWANGSLTSWAKYRSGSCYFTGLPALALDKGFYCGFSICPGSCPAPPPAATPSTISIIDYRPIANMRSGPIRRRPRLRTRNGSNFVRDPHLRDWDYQTALAPIYFIIDRCARRIPGVASRSTPTSSHFNAA